MYKHNVMQGKLSKLEDFASGYKGLFKDKRLFDGFVGSLQGIIASKSLRISQIASHSSLLGKGNHTERRVRRLVHDANSRAVLEADELTKTLTEEGAKRLKGEHEVLLLLDESDLRKPFANCIEHLDTVRSLEGTAVSGFHTLNVLAIAESGLRVIVYHHSFSTLEPNFKSISHEHEKAITLVTRALRAKAVGRLVWIMDRGFDDIKVMRQIHNSGDCFLIRVQHMKRKCLLKNKPSKFDKALSDAPVLATASLERRLIDPAAKRNRHDMLPVKLKAVEVELAEALGLMVCLNQIHGLNTKTKGWVLVSNFKLKQHQQEDFLIRQLKLYRQRWAIEELFAWSKDALGWESVQVMSFAALRTLVAFAWIAAAFLHHLGTNKHDPSVEFLVKLGATQANPKANPRTLAAGLSHLASFLIVTQHAQTLAQNNLPKLIKDLFP